MLEMESQDNRQATTILVTSQEVRLDSLWPLGTVASQSLEKNLAETTSSVDGIFHTMLRLLAGDQTAVKIGEEDSYRIYKDRQGGRKE